MVVKKNPNRKKKPKKQKKNKEKQMIDLHQQICEKDLRKIDSFTKVAGQ